ncbi:MAG: GAF domain-containing protein [Anaerolineae bacterium]|nr:GAF domain-containing protein [Anaerolineae bacterium]
MIAVFRRYYERLLAPYTDFMDRQYARLLVILSAVSLVTIAAFVLSLVFVSPDILDAGATVFLIGLPLPFSVITLWLLERGRLESARLTYLIYNLLLVIITTFALDLLVYSVVLLPFGLIVAAALDGRRGVLAGGLVIAVAVSLTLLGEAIGLMPRETLDHPEFVNGLLTIGVVFGFSVLLLSFLTSLTERTLEANRQRIRRLEAANAISQLTGAQLDQPGLMDELVDLIQTRLGHDHVQIFLLDERRQNAVLTASTGEAGKQLLARDHQLPVGSRSVIGRVTELGQMVYAADTSRSAVHRRNEILSESRAEIAFPLMSSERVIGALDVQSKRANAFSPAEIETLEVLAKQLSAALHSYRVLESAKNQTEQAQRQHEETRLRLQEIERTNRQLTRQAWEDFLTIGQVTSGIQIEGGEAAPLTAEWTAALQQAITQDRVVVLPEPETERTTVAVPLELRGNTLGALEVALPADANLEDSRELIEAVASRLALALDNTRLFEEASARAEQERQIGQIAGQLQSTVEIEDMLKIAVQELQAAVGASRSAIRLRSIADSAAQPADAVQS